MRRWATLEVMDALEVMDMTTVSHPRDCTGTLGTILGQEDVSLSSGRPRSLGGWLQLIPDLWEWVSWDAVRG